MNSTDKGSVKFLNKIFNYLIAIGLIVFGIFFYLKQKGYIKPKNDLHLTESSSLDIDRMVNQHLQETNQKIMRDQIDSTKAIDAALQQAKKLKERPVPVLDIPREAQIAKDRPMAPVFPYKPSQKPDSQLQGLSKEEYARQFIENARRGGYEIELSDDLEVIRSTPIRKPSQEIDSVEIFPSN